MSRTLDRQEAPRIKWVEDSEENKFVACDLKDPPLVAGLLKLFPKKPAAAAWEHYKTEFSKFGKFLPELEALTNACLLRIGCDPVRPASEGDFENALALFEAIVATGSDAEVHTPFVRHQDNDGGVSGKVNTLLVYLRCTAQGGGLSVYGDGDAGDDGSGGSPAVCTISPRAEEGDRVRVVVMSGDTWHLPEPIRGPGERLAVVLQLPVQAPALA